MLPYLLDLADAAWYLSVSVPYLRRVIAARAIAHVRLGRRVLLRRRDLEAFADGHLVPPGDGDPPP